MPPSSAVTEKELLAEVTRLATGCGWKWWHFHDSRRQVTDRVTKQRIMIGDEDAKGFPDLFMCHPTRGMLHVELKGSTTRIEPHQIVALDRIAESAMSMSYGGGPKVRVHLWRPDGFVNVGARVLTRGEGPIVYGWSRLDG